MKRCQSCGRLTELLEDFAGLDQSSIYCSSCADGNGKLRTFEEVLENLTQRIAKTDGFDESASRNAALQILGRQPAWEPKFAREEGMKKNKQKIAVIAISICVAIITAGVTFWLARPAENSDDTIFAGYSLSKGANPFEQHTSKTIEGYIINRFACQGDQIPTMVDNGLLKVKSLEDFGSIWKMTKRFQDFGYLSEFDLLGDRQLIVKNMPYLSTYWNSYVYDTQKGKNEAFQPECNNPGSVLKNIDHPMVFIDDNPEQKRMIFTKTVSENNCQMHEIMPMDQYRLQKDENKTNHDFMQIMNFSFDRASKSQLTKDGRMITDIESFELDHDSYFEIHIPFRQPKFYNPATGKTKTIPMNLDSDFDYIFNDRYFVWTRLRKVDCEEIPFSFDISNFVIDSQNIEDNREILNQYIDWRYNRKPAGQPYQELMCFDMQTSKTYTVVSHRQTPVMGLEVNFKPLAITNNCVYYWNYYVNRLYSYEMLSSKLTKFDKPWFDIVIRSNGKQVLGKIQDFMVNREGKKINQLEDVALVSFDDSTATSKVITDGKINEFWVSQGKASEKQFIVYSRVTPKVPEPYSYYSRNLNSSDSSENLVFKADRDSKKMFGLFGSHLVWFNQDKSVIKHPVIEFGTTVSRMYHTLDVLPSEYNLEVESVDEPQYGQLYATNLETGKTTQLDDGCCWGVVSDGKLLSWARFKQSDSDDIDVCYTTLE